METNFMDAWKNNHIKEIGFKIELWSPYENNILYNYLNHIGDTYHLYVSF
jgi:hypothetical protein